MTVDFGEFIAFADESGNSSAKGYDPNYPAFVLVICMFRKSDYVDDVVPRLYRFKHKHFGHETVILHERDIRKCQGKFGFLTNPDKREGFFNELTDIVSKIEFTISGCIIRRREVNPCRTQHDNLYHRAAEVSIEIINEQLGRFNNQDATTHVIFEGRGKLEDQALVNAFSLAQSKSRTLQQQSPIRLVVASKMINSIGLQVADLVARPLGLKTLRPDQFNRAADVLASKIHRIEILDE
jgi:hypothetical protein